MVFRVELSDELTVLVYEKGTVSKTRIGKAVIPVGHWASGNVFTEDFSLEHDHKAAGTIHVTGQLRRPDGRPIGSPMMEMKNITLKFGGVTALSNISFNILEGEIRAIIGPNGAGKSSMLNVINGFYHPQEGTITLRGEKRTKMKPYDAAASGIARTFQNIELFEQATVLQNLLVGRHHRTSRNPFTSFAFLPAVKNAEIEHRRKVEDIIDLLELAQYRDERIADLSYGARKNVELARALCAEPTMLLLDEPAGGVNLTMLGHLKERLKTYNREHGTTFVVIEHNMDILAEADSLIDMGPEAGSDGGSIVSQGTPEQVSKSKQSWLLPSCPRLFV